MKVFWHKVSDEKWVIAVEPCAVLCELHLLSTAYEGRCLGRTLYIGEPDLEVAKAKTKRWFRNLIRELSVELESDKP